MNDQAEQGNEKRGFFTTLPGILAAVAALITALATAAGVFIAARDPGSPTNPAGGTSAPTSTVVAEDYYTTDGSKPRLAPACEGIFNLCLGTPIESAISLLGVEVDRYGAENVVYRQWQLGESRITVGADEVGSIVSLSASTGSDTGFRLLLPGALILGESTMGQVWDQRGAPDQKDSFSAENMTFYSYIYCVGPEATVKAEFSYGAEIGSPEDPGGLANLPGEQVHTYSVDYGC